MAFPSGSYTIMSTAPFVIFVDGQSPAFVSFTEPPAGISHPAPSVMSRDGVFPVFAQVILTPSSETARPSRFVRTMNSEPSPPPSSVLE